jgi:hypothetical protein
MSMTEAPAPAAPGHGDTEGLVWTKSSVSASQNQCVEVALGDGGVLVRHSRRPEGPWLSFTLPEWNAFLAGAALGEFDPEGGPAPAAPFR